MKRLGAMLAALALLVCTGCGRAEGTPVTAEQGSAACLAVYVQQVPGAEALAQAYCQARGLELLLVQEQAQADVCILPHTPTGMDWQTLSEDPLLAAALGQGVQAAGLGGTAYGWLADGAVLQDVFDSDSFGGLQNASWEEWQALTETLGGWLAAPAATPLSLGGVDYTLSATRGSGALLLEQLFALPEQNGYSGAALAPALAAGWSAETGLDGTVLAEAWQTFALEAAQGAQGASALAQLSEGTALFARGSLAQAALTFGLDAELTQRLVLVPLKFSFSGDQAGRPVWAQGGWMAVPAAADTQAAARGRGFILWVRTTQEGAAALERTTGLLQAGAQSAETALGQQQLAWSQSGTITAWEESQARAEGLESAWQNAQSAEEYASLATQALG